MTFITKSNISRRSFLRSAAGLSVLAASNILPAHGGARQQKRRPNLVFILTDDQRYDALRSAGNPTIITPNIDSLARTGILFKNAFVATSVCSASRACSFTGRYGSANGVRGLGGGLNPGEKIFAQYLKDAGYQTGHVGKWHLTNPRSPANGGFDFEAYFGDNGPHYDRKVMEHGHAKIAKGFIEIYNSEQAIEFMTSAVNRDAPFLLSLATQLPHLNQDLRWEPKPETLALYEQARIPIPSNWQDDLSGKPPYLKTERHRERGQAYGYDDKTALLNHIKRYYAVITEMDRALGNVLAAIDRLNLRDNTYIIFMSDNGWFLGEHKFSSKVLPYEESIRVPCIISGPGIRNGVSDKMVLNADVAPTLLELAGIPVPANMHGRSLMPHLKRQKTNWRTSILYESLVPTLGAHPLVAVRTERWKYIQTFDLKDPKKLAFEELYDLRQDPGEMNNVAGASGHRKIQESLKAELALLRKAVR